MRSWRFCFYALMHFSHYRFQPALRLAPPWPTRAFNFASSATTFALVLAGQPLNEVRSDVQRLVFARQIFREQHAVGIGIIGVYGVVSSGNNSFGVSRLTSVMYFTRRNHACTR